MDAPPLRRHQALALEALGRAWDEGRDRAWVVLPPGSGKTRMGLESVARMLGAGQVTRGVVLGPNTAIQAQWVAQGAALGLDTGTERDLATPLTSLTYQSVAVFDADAEADDDGDEVGELVSRLHPNGAALVAALRDAGPILLVLDECHHLLEVWGRLLADLLEELPQARGLGLTATPPDALSADQAALVDALFGGVVYETSIPAVVREGDLAPFAELVWLTTPTQREREWVDGSALRFRELVTTLTDPALGSVPFLTWVDRRFVEREHEVAWPALVKAEPALCDAALRLHHAGLLALPPGARPTEEHRRDPTAEDWMTLVDDWVTGHLARSEHADDARLLAAVRAALPSVGYTLTRHGVRRGRSPVDRVLARSESKTEACVEIARVERLALGERLRLLVLCDHERASATLPADLEGVLSPQAGSAVAVLEALLASPASADALLVTGSTVAGAPQTLDALVDHVAATDPGRAATLRVVPGDGLAARLEGRWSSRVWVAHVTRFLEAGGTTVLVGTRGLLGEGWDARSITGLVDLTSVTTTTAVVQTRGRALRTDPERPDKVALNWSVVCLSEEHPRGDNDWARLVRKHRGFFGVDEDGEVVDGVGHVDPTFSPYAPPPDAEVDAVNARMVLRAEDRDGIRARWRVGESYADTAARTVRVRPRRADLVGASTGPAALVVRPTGLEHRTSYAPPGEGRTLLVGGPLAGVLALCAVVAGLPPTWIALLLGLLAAAVVGGGGHAIGRRQQHRARLEAGAAVVAEASRPPSVAQVAAAVADALLAADLVPVGSAGVVVEPDAEGEYRCRLEGVTEADSAVFATALDEALSPLVTPRYVLPRHVVTGRRRTEAEVAEIGRTGTAEPDGTVWHPVPSVLGTNAARARGYARAWDRWIGGGAALHRLARGCRRPGRPAGQRPLRRGHRDAPSVGLTADVAEMHARGGRCVRRRRADLPPRACRTPTSAVGLG